MTSLDTNAIVLAASQIGHHLSDVFPPVESNAGLTIDPMYVRPIADNITLVVAEILQSWLDAGSERDVTLEELGPVIEDHVRQWAVVD